MKYKITYRLVGEIVIDADDQMDAIQRFVDKVGFSKDDLYENLDHNPLIMHVEEDE
jgi:hypothetical protein